MVPAIRFSNSLLYKEHDVCIFFVLNDQPKRVNKHYNYFLLLYLSSHGLENRGKMNTLKCVLVNPVKKQD